ncbi:hypothetical protein [Actibacterium ureilyticum]|uniref:hypothetical protein n=1 Tax=Actibacterium ureilyticum TaxID=1590614 RepID=UPI001140EE5A|nr:hypothetical protein [Actibacterium ureilyticum]
MTRTLCGMVLLIVTTHAASALPGSPQQRAEMFATCAGRLQAMATRQRADRDPDANQTERFSADFLMLLEATLPAAIADGLTPQQAVTWRSSGWVEVAYLLADRYYSHDPTRIDRATQRLSERLSHCRDLILPG